jgi:hypothetical protein
MALHLTPEEHDANPPESWHVVKAADRVWHLRQGDEPNPLESFTTKHAAEEAKRSGFLFDLYAREGRWMAGENVHPYKPYAECKPRMDAAAARRAEARA